MASYRKEPDFTAEVIPFLLNREDYLGFFLRTNLKNHSLMTFVIRKKDFVSRTEFMKNLAIIYDSLSNKSNPAQ